MNVSVKSQSNVLTAIHNAFSQNSFPFRVLISSRAELSIRDVFDSELADSTYQISLDDKYEPDQDIMLYLRSKFFVNTVEIVACPLCLYHGLRKRIFKLLSKRLLASLFTQQHLLDMLMFAINDPGPTRGLTLFLDCQDRLGTPPNPFAELDELY